MSLILVIWFTPMPNILATYGKREDENGDLWIDVSVNGLPYDSLGPFDSEREFHAAFDDLREMVLFAGGADVPRVLS